MGLNATSSATTFTPAPAGTHTAICCQVIDLGDQFSKFYGKVKHKVLIGWELPDEKDDKGEPFLVWNRYTCSTHEKAVLGQHLESWRGKPFTESERNVFSLKGLLGAPCLLSIVHETNDGKTYARVKSVMALPKSTPKPKPTHKHVLFDIDAWDAETFATFNDNLKKTIEGREKKANGSAAHANGSSPVSAAEVAEAMADDIPF